MDTNQPDIINKIKLHNSTELFYYHKKQEQLSYLNGHLSDKITFFFSFTCLNLNSNMIKDSVQKFTKKSQLKKKSCNEK